MSTTIERIKGLRANREGRYHDLVIEAGACEVLPKQLSELAALNPWLRVVKEKV